MRKPAAAGRCGRKLLRYLLAAEVAATDLLRYLEDESAGLRGVGTLQVLADHAVR